MKLISRVAVAAVAALTTAAIALGASAGPPPSLAAGEWPQAHSDLTPDPAVRFGALPNGMRYAIMRNATPPGQVSMRLRFDVGSLMERDDQQGLAHFLEHMAFNGSTNVPTRGDMVKDLERLGLAFGADTNAGTDFDNTTYKFNLPKSDDQTVDTSLMLLREIASNLRLDQAAMDQERGVILSEERLRDTPSFRIYKSQLGFAMEGQRPPERLPIGLVPVIQSAQRDLLAEIYRHYYRPERATLVVVGDIDPAAIEAKIKARFSDWQGQGPAGADPDLGPVKPRGPDFRMAVETGAPTAFELAWVAPPDLDPDTQAKRRRQIIQQLGLSVLNRRLATLVRAADPPFISAGAARGDTLRAERVTGLVVIAQPDHWKPALAAAETEVRRAVQYGVRPDELAREITEDEASLRNAVAGASTRRTPALADEIADSLSDQVVVIDPAAELALFEAAIKGLTADQVSAALKDTFHGGGPLVLMSTPQAVDGGVAAIRTAFDAASAAPVSAPTAPVQVDWPYTNFGTPGKVVDRQDITDLDAVFIRFDNGVRLTIKPTKFHQDQVLVRVRFGDGRDGEPPDQQALNWAQSSFTEGGLAKISSDDTERALAGAVYGVSVGIDANAYVLGGETRGDDLETQLQVLAAYMTDPGWRPAAFERLKNYGATLETQLAATDGGVMSRDLQGLLRTGDGRWTFPSPTQIGAETEDQLKAEMTPSLASGPIEVTVVGDITLDKAVAAVADTFGALPKRPDPPPPGPPAHNTRFPAPTPSPLVETHTGRADQGIAYVAWPTDDFFANVAASRANSMLSRVLQLRITDVLRMQQGVTYSPSAGQEASTFYPHWGYISAQMEAPPEKLDGFFADIAKIAADLRANPVSDDELERAKKPAIDALEKARATNQYWLDRLSGAQADPRLLDAIRSAEPGLERVSAADIQHAAQTWLRDDTAWKLEIRPQTPAVAAN
jgi:zinc protease